jgi:putative membrane protein
LLYMTTELVLRYLHFISIFGIVGALVSEHLLLKRELSRAEIGRLSRIDAVYGLSALLLLLVGLTLWLGGFGKPSYVYTKNWVFHLKITLFAIIGLLSIYPTFFFIKQRKGDPDEVVKIPDSIFWILRIEILLLFTIPFLAGLMSRGIGYFG